MSRTWSKRSEPHRELAVHADAQRGEDVKELQRAIGARGRTRGVAPVEVDGIMGTETYRAAKQLGYLLGALKSTTDKPHLTVGLQQMIIEPEKRSAAQLARAAVRKRKVPSLRERAFKNALADLDVRERGGNNRGADVEKIIRANGGTPGEPWCGDAVAYWYLKAGAKSVVRSWAAVRLLEQLLTRVRFPMRGHVVIYNFDGGVPDHTGLFDEWKDRRAGWFYAVEGNTNQDSRASDSGGGEGVHRRLRHISDVDSFRRVTR